MDNTEFKKKNYKIIVAAGGTGGHLFPAIAVIQQLDKMTDFLLDAHFIGCADKIEARVVPQFGYEFSKINITGFTGILTINTLLLPVKIFRSILKCKKIIKQFKPDAAICTGAYISYPLGVAAHQESIPLFLMESNVIPGKTIKMLAPKAEMIITSYTETLKYFHPEVKPKVKCLGNPIRENLIDLPPREESLRKFGLSESKKTVLVFGGSLGARSINEATKESIKSLPVDKIQFIWQTGKNFKIEDELPDNVKVIEFIDDMASAYSAADLIISRSGATSCSEICSVGKPSILVPYPNAANNEQELNALVLADNDAAIVVYDNEIGVRMTNLINLFLNKPNQFLSMGLRAKTFSNNKAALMIAQNILEKTNYYK